MALVTVDEGVLQRMIAAASQAAVREALAAVPSPTQRPATVQSLSTDNPPVAAVIIDGDTTVSYVQMLGAKPLTGTRVMVFSYPPQAAFAIPYPAQWQTTTPVITGTTVTLGTGGWNVQESLYVDGVVFVEGSIFLGTGGDIAGGPMGISMPYQNGHAKEVVGVAKIFDDAPNYYVGIIELAAGGDEANFRFVVTGSSPTAVDSVGGTNPFNWDPGDAIQYSIWYRV